jgi:hypothetical protein
VGAPLRVCSVHSDPCSASSISWELVARLTARFDLAQRIINQLCVGITLKGRDQAVMSDERTIAKAVGVSLTVVFVTILILSAISY